MAARWMVIVVTALLFVSAVKGQSYPGYYIDREGIRKEAIFKIKPVFLSKRPDFGSIITGISCTESGKKYKLTPGMCQSIHFKFRDQNMEFLAMSNLAGRKTYNTDSIFLRPKVIGPVSLYYFYYYSRSPYEYYENKGTIVAGKPGPMSVAKQGWLIAGEDGSILKITRKCNRKELAEFFSDYERLSGMILSASSIENLKKTENLVLDYNSWKIRQETNRGKPY